MLWKKDIEIEDWVTRFTVGDDYRWDTLLIDYDITGTLVHAKGLVDIGILTIDELDTVETALSELLDLVEKGQITVRPIDEDCHTVIEQFLTIKLGDVGKKIHTGRSRNDQVLTALRLFIKDQLVSLMNALISVTNHLCALGDTYRKVIMPGYTHYQRAMPSTGGLWALGYAELLLSDLESIQHAYRQVNTSPLGSAAGYGVPFLPLPRTGNTERLNFGSMQTHVTVVQLSRGKLELHAVHALLQVAATFNRMASDLILFNTSEFGFVNLPAEFCTGSSIMPQKKNPDVLELVRANYHRILAEMNVLMTLPANLPSGYHRDLQLTKESVMKSLLLTHDVVVAMDNLIPGITFMPDKMQEATTTELYATSIALEKVMEGTPFRDAYREAANRVETIQSPSADEALNNYRVEGYPGKSNATLIRTQLEKSVEWLNEVTGDQ